MEVLPPKILILYASYGEGHVQAARAIKDSLRRLGHCEVRLLDLMAESHPWLNSLTKFVYMQSFKTIPQLYGWVYNITRGMQATSAFGHVLHSFGMRQLTLTLKKELPDLVVHTFPQLALPALRRKMGMHLPIVNVVTDFDLHGRWLHPDIDRYYVATEDMQQEAAQRGIPIERIAATGIPIHASFYNMSADEAPVQEQLIPPLQAETTTLLIMAGAYGVLSGIMDICQQLSQLPQLRLLIVCGRNQQLKAELDALYADYPDIYTYGFVDFVPALMRASNLVITKPGGITLSESIASGLPILVFKPVPGQELNNALYLQQKGAARIARTTEELIQHCLDLISIPSLAGEMTQAIKLLRKPHPADQIAEDILHQLVDKRTSVRTN
ncbi:MGDG synthase family glycosyltransferase [Paenibacillus sp. SEL3]|uniref:Diacylglycerol glucosyltransferase n=1 Tax=Paenibacillus polymyxa TaxID=1406 RepID=A0A8I1LRX5_PAEPO|nr:MULTISPECIES: glycosyltransferase [Paenibacillus]KAF6573795.1 diacylglycerol glucosyltransferase [Paenibacillus sp. EKM206P]KAF6588320.1 diacylglycerol glucosyltransferase [Paenibacillus sp. EKM205P]MBM0634690.1 diacylglycerol glucosyltransferase [Paenibacillus polymyxa]MBO3283007.1 diacylglycerol glucosyltransferase [Paenibacillus polymyxa]MDY8093614.1 glycosyltransferase [Paenibacillus polymyxa]